MSRYRVLRDALVMALAFVVLPVAPTSAQTYPSRNITLVVGFAAGGVADSIGRLVGQKLTERSWPDGGGRESRRGGRQYRRQERRRIGS